MASSVAATRSTRLGLQFCSSTYPNGEGNKKARIPALFRVVRLDQDCPLWSRRIGCIWGLVRAQGKDGALYGGLNKSADIDMKTFGQRPGQAFADLAPASQDIADQSLRSDVCQILLF